jgi:hypothetical protein
MKRDYWVIKTGCFAPGSTHNDWGTSRPGLLPPMAIKSKPPAARVVVEPSYAFKTSSGIFMFAWRLFI